MMYFVGPEFPEYHRSQNPKQTFFWGVGVNFLCIIQDGQRSLFLGREISGMSKIHTEIKGLKAFPEADVW